MGSAARAKEAAMKHGLSTAERLEWYSHPEPNSGCILWHGHYDWGGYARINLPVPGGNHVYKAHRVAWQVKNGPIPAGMHLCHKCDNRGCINPDHLFLGSNAENMADKVAKGRQARGEKMRVNKLTASQVMEIYNMEGSTRQIAAKVGIGKSQVHLIKSGQGWRHLHEKNTK